ncbi:TetR/AcrR family transcriptional regulator [Arcobacter sp. F2176]|uniref:TetR/AcrR family transcriptional regulator n=1 Tax=Arcobacter sp. F2176 TaxID=2044511 RepID=UPI00100A806D|nr:TetR/AcrR family transcriptional regulator [Arcobacter sp. F2176]RXJ81242.1 TetR family transcriptional regulator [Arcobacter sp. F2176]
MRKKTETKRQTIIQAATEVFKEFGFERASMSKICAKAGGSKTTLYNYFPSKEELFFEVVSMANAEDFIFVHKILDESNEGKDVSEQLCEFGKRYLAFLYSPKLKELRRLTISQSGITDLGKIAYNNRVLKSQNIISNFLEKNIKLNKIKKIDTSIASKHLCGLLESELMYQFLFQIDMEFSKKEMDQMAIRAINVFMDAYRA